MYPTRNAQNNQASCHGAGWQELASAKRQPSRRFATGLWLSGLLLVAVAQGTQAESTGGEALTHSESSVAAQLSVGIRPLNSLDDTQLESIRGRYVDARTQQRSAGGEADFVILWDERPTGGGGNDTKTSHSRGLGNQQSTSVTTRREQ
ncbi:hypothetical protein [Halomonas garicola]|uniref:hypothetical protein n=1 Tax=Halomonas garicola TaxID=1690008 RepID=UPI00289F8CF4|nr:hypothetical protein [Halomonas garicola]